ncbi:MAG: hypothetical protein ACO263_00360 [Cyclobacteriaceae bacterium]|jgi:uncharacterized membrane protein
MSTGIVTDIEFEQERASNIYLMSLAIVIVGLPLPIINLIATFFMYLSNRNKTWFIRWHSLQALLSQTAIALINGFGMYWTLSVIFTDETVSNPYIAYLITLFTFNLLEFIGTIYAAVQTRSGYHVSFWFFGPLTDLLCPKENSPTA